MAHAYKPVHHGSVAHAFTNSILYLNYHRPGYQQEVLNRWALLGGMEALDAKLELSEFAETHIFNSNKVLAVYEAR